ncbi:MAG: DNA-processing protein DprA [Clostridia bacterium]|nr:DNA-processing protein DprA [Clostridia bacterium]
MKKITINQRIYPNILKKIKNPPSVLYTEGNLDLLKSSSIAIIGSRQASEKGKKFAKRFSTELSSTGITIVSGLARGIDTVAHTYSYNQKGKTIAVLGSGFNKIFPPENIDLYKKILDNGGLVISEYSPDTEPSSAYFPVRNRIISGLSLGVLVIEAKYRSGTNKTAEFATKQHKPVFVLPHSIDDPHGIGTNRLLKKGAIPITDSSDIFEKLKLLEFKEIYENLKVNKNTDSKIEIDTIDAINSFKAKQNFSDPKQSKIFKIIKEKPITPNDLARKTKFSINEIQSILFILEMDGSIKKVQGGYICI